MTYYVAAISKNSKEPNAIKSIVPTPTVGGVTEIIKLDVPAPMDTDTVDEDKDESPKDETINGEPKIETVVPTIFTANSNCQHMASPGDITAAPSPVLDCMASFACTFPIPTYAAFVGTTG